MTAPKAFLRISRKVCLRGVLVSAQLIVPVHHLMAQSGPSNDTGEIEEWLIGIGVVALLVSFWVSLKSMAKRGAKREARLAEERRAKEAERLAAERRAKESARLAARHKEEVERIAAKRRAEKEAWANALPFRLETAMTMERTPDKILELVFHGHPDSAAIVRLVEAKGPFWSPQMEEALSDILKVLFTVRGQGKQKTVSALESAVQSLIETKARSEVRSGAPSQSSSSPVSNYREPPIRFKF